ncbi:MAG: A24 family peptidase [Spirochaetia bacterium]|jgi:leader peptidase (prepilin peptidase)/N-methyltransferase|nr:A24 family peptidase [Spirochaetia bacterium]
MEYLMVILFLVFSIPACIIDIKQKRIPDWTVFSGVTVIIAFRLLILGDLIKIILLELISAPLIFIGIRSITKGKLGMGDVKFAALMAIYIGFPGWFIATGVASLLGLLFAVLGLFSGRLNRNTRIPFAPFLTVGSIGAYFVNYDILLNI